MTKTHLRTVLTLTGLAALMSCDDGSAQTGTLGSDDCPIGTFRPEGLADCVFPATDQFGNPLGVSDNRCATGQPAVPPSCVSDVGLRAYLSTSKACAAGYRFEPAACQRGGGPLTGTAGVIGTAGVTGAAGAGTFGEGTGFGTGAAGTSSSGAGTGGPAGDGSTGVAGSGSTGAAEVTGAAGTSPAAGATGGTT